MFAAAFEGDELTLGRDAVEHRREVAKVVISRELRDANTFCDEVSVRTAATPIERLAAFTGRRVR
jgi:hypothetical protein